MKRTAFAIAIAIAALLSVAGVGAASAAPIAPLNHGVAANAGHLTQVRWGHWGGHWGGWHGRYWGGGWRWRPHYYAYAAYPVYHRYGWGHGWCYWHPRRCGW